MFTYFLKIQQILIALLLCKTCSLCGALNHLPGRSSPFVHFAAFCLINTWMSVHRVFPTSWHLLLASSSLATHTRDILPISVSLAGGEVQLISRQASSMQALHAHRYSRFLQESSFSLLLQALAQCSISALANSRSVSLECKFLSLPTGMIQKEPNSSCTRRDSGWISGKIS